MTISILQRADLLGGCCTSVVGFYGILHLTILEARVPSEKSTGQALPTVSGTIVGRTRNG